ncbi:hypothetical protein I5M27_13460 [Adhaeribacter sp. BT258]|uniref:Uncharacterized protein n=1 Tax=Adhaeribacter terrigena TaxID=2793070 RepID=A0ABS1C3M0_9BACT|nr:hypothetical protein [Adhaeribacter terrigena]MBK0403996.1 hypothetical protein [Adhaeribacter terrigena]
MAQQTFFLNNDPAQPLTLTWGFNWKNLRITYLGEAVGEINSKKELLQGQEFTLPNNQTLTVKLKGSFMPQLEVLADQQALSGSATHPESVLEQAFKLSAILGALNFVLGFVAIFWPTEVLLRLGMGMETVFTGALIMALAYGIKKRSMAALIASICFWILDYGLSIYFASQNEGAVNPSSGLIMRMVIVFTLYRGIAALKQIRQQQAAIELAK